MDHSQDVKRGEERYIQVDIVYASNLVPELDVLQAVKTKGSAQPRRNNLLYL